MASGTVVRVGERELSLSNLDKVLYPNTGTTKGEAINYYARIAPVMVPHLAGRCITLKRFPNGVESAGFFEKRCPKHRPSWIPTALGPGDHDGDIGYCRFDEQASLVWAANMAALELHVPMAASSDLETPLAVVFDFDPGAPAAMKECCEVALWVREVLEAVGLEGWC
jgi:bifunctional non-homologous end joining protein LigD